MPMRLHLRLHLHLHAALRIATAIRQRRAVRENVFPETGIFRHISAMIGTECAPIDARLAEAAGRDIVIPKPTTHCISDRIPKFLGKGREYIMHRIMLITFRAHDA